MNDPTNIQRTISGTVSVSEYAVASEFGDGVSIMNLETGAYYRLQGVAWFVWRELATLPTFEDLCVAIQDVYRVSPEVGARDLELLLRDLLRGGLITVQHP